MVNFVISLSKNNEKRREHISNEFLLKEVGFEFFNAVTPSDIYDMSKIYKLDIGKTNLSEVEFSCFLSHYSLWVKMLDENLGCIGIFEDDIYLSNDSEKYLNDYSWVPDHVDIIKVENFFDEIFVRTKPNEIDENRKLYRLAGGNLGTAGYIITNKGAKKLVERFSNLEFFGAIDTEIFDKFIRDNNYVACQIAPSLCVQDFILNQGYNEFPSQIEIERKEKLKNLKIKKLKHPLKYKLKREMVRIFYKLHELFRKMSIRKVTIKFK